MIKKLLWVLLAILVIAALIFYSNKDQWLQEFNQERQQQQSEYIARGKLFGDTANQQQCLDKSLEQLGNCFSYGCTLDHGAYLRSCLQNAQPSASFCKGVPAYQTKASQADKQWLKDNCWNRNLNGESCRFLFKQQMNFCSVNK